MKCSECPACQFDSDKRTFTCRCTGAEVRVSRRSSFVMPLLGLRDRQQSWADGDDDRLFCPATLDRLLGNQHGRGLALSVLKQIDDKGQLAFCLSLYPASAAAKLRKLMFAESVRLLGLRRAVV